ncbi:high nitrogen upregulated cytochrome P450 monooxygenase 2 [Mycena albidolilacea]|uniref:High nitrogen upregulated cytochrome P450 monooxygenase 2 n=1 Tax=Mycena albidolilacea TaxID=1033008 RepID=A0AAD6Z113_9AGAR|nr:high nitrogen upregulated cytochrome P450 monooxygenase 2 [Mycena albidolilacea]
MDSPLSLWAAALGLVNHFFFHKYEPASAQIPVILLALEPPALLSLVGGPLTFVRLLWTYFVFLATLGVSIALYRLSPFHPLAEYPGPAISKVTRLWDLYKALYGYKYLYHKELHDKYGPYVRVGPNEVSIIEAEAVTQTLNFGGLDKGRYYESGRNPNTPPTVACSIGAAHTAKRRVWNRSMTSAAIREYDPVLEKRAQQLVSCLRQQVGTVDFVHWIDLFAFDLMSDLAFGGGFEMMRDGRDNSRLGERIAGYMKAFFLPGQLPWIIPTLNLFPQMAKNLKEFNDFAENLAMKRMQSGAAGSGTTMDLWYHLSDEAGVEKVKPTLAAAAGDGKVGIIAASDTTASAMTCLVWSLCSNPDIYRRLQQEIDSVFVDGVEDCFDANKHEELHFLTACMNETLRLYPPVLSNGTRQIRLGQEGRIIGGKFIPEGTSVSTPAYSLHRNPDYFYPGPDQFLPQRWLPDSKFERHNLTAFIPFSLGAANCVGQRFAKREMLSVMSLLLKSFEFKFAPDFDAQAWPKTMQDYYVTLRQPMRVVLNAREGKHNV